MDNIDIIDPTFSLDVPNFNEIISDNIVNETTEDYAIYIYIGVALLVFIICIFIFKHVFKTKMSEENEDDCPGGFCTMNPSNKQI